MSVRAGQGGVKKTKQAIPKVRGVRVDVDCPACLGKGWIKPANRRILPTAVRYGPEDHELVRCPLCHGRKAVIESITLEELAKLLPVMRAFQRRTDDE